MAEEEKTVGMSSAVDFAEAKNVDPTLEKHAYDADEAMKAFDELQGDTIELDESTSRRLLRSIDWHMMPIMCCVYGMNYLDSTTVLTAHFGTTLTKPQKPHFPMRASWA